MHYCVSQKFSYGLGRIVVYVFAIESFDLCAYIGVPVDELKSVLNLLVNRPVKLFTVKEYGTR